MGKYEVSKSTLNADAWELVLILRVDLNAEANWKQKILESLLSLNSDLPTQTKRQLK